eukprot:7249194-Pyramimonas_sp.AAC.1
MQVESRATRTAPAQDIPNPKRATRALKVPRDGRDRAPKSETKTSQKHTAPAGQKAGVSQALGRQCDHAHGTTAFGPWLYTSWG